MRARYYLVSCLGLLCLGSLAQANITIDTVTVGDPGNLGELSHSRIRGSVGYNYKIGKYEVTAGQYAAFLNSKAKTETYELYHWNMSSTSEGSGITRQGAPGSYTYSVASAFVNRPVNFVSFWDSCRFANWLGNGQGNGDTETGAYTLTPDGIANNTITRNAGWKWAVTSEDEWYKAAYYKGGSTNAGYWLYPTRTDTLPGRNMADASGNNANYFISGGAYPIDSGKYTTVAGEFQNSRSPYGTFDQGGNVAEWNEAIPYDGYAYRGYRGLRGGSFCNSDYGLLQKWVLSGEDATSEVFNFGFRVSAVVPEPSSLLAVGSCILALAGMIRRRNG